MKWVDPRYGFEERRIAVGYDELDPPSGKAPCPEVGQNPFQEGRPRESAKRKERISLLLSEWMPKAQGIAFFLHPYLLDFFRDAIKKEELHVAGELAGAFHPHHPRRSV